MPDFSNIEGGSRFATYGVAYTFGSPPANGYLGKTTWQVSGTAHTKGAWQEIVASTDFETQALFIHIGPTANNNRDCLVDIGVGPEGSEVPIVENLYYCQGVRPREENYYIPISVPVGTRLSVRAQLNLDSSPTLGVQLSITIASQSLGASQPLSRCVTYGANPSDTGGTGVDCNQNDYTPLVFGPWSEISPATSTPIKAMAVAIGSQGVARTSACTFWMDIGIGEAFNEVPLIQKLILENYGANAITQPMIPLHFVPLDLPAGVRLVARAMQNKDDGVVAEQKFDVILYTFC